jgi:hypothetical protein
MSRDEQSRVIDELSNVNSKRSVSMGAGISGVGEQ